MAKKTRWCQAPLRKCYNVTLSFLYELPVKYLVTGTVKRKNYNITKILRTILDVIVIHLPPVFADVFPIFWKPHSCDQLLFGKSGGPLDGLIDQLDKLHLECIR